MGIAACWAVYSGGGRQGAGVGGRGWVGGRSGPGCVSGSEVAWGMLESSLACIRRPSLGWGVNLCSFTAARG
jgi:hypothetical protein